MSFLWAPSNVIVSHKNFVFCEFLGQTDRHPSLWNAYTVDTYLPTYVRKTTALIMPISKLTCIQAHRTLIVCLLTALESIIDMYQVHVVMGPEGWYFSGEGHSLPDDPLHGFKKLKELYLKADRNHDGRYTVPVLWDKKADALVHNVSSDIIRMLYSELTIFYLKICKRSINQAVGCIRSSYDNRWTSSTLGYMIQSTMVFTKRGSTRPRSLTRRTSTSCSRP